MATSVRARYVAMARHRFPHLEAELPITKASKLTVVVVNAGEAVHFVYTASPSPEPTACRHVTLAPPEGLTLRDWAWLHEQDYVRFVERGIAGERLGSFHVFPEEGDDHARAVMAADAMVHAHAQALEA